MSGAVAAVSGAVAAVSGAVVGPAEEAGAIRPDTSSVSGAPAVRPAGGPIAAARRPGGAGHGLLVGLCGAGPVVSAPSPPPEADCSSSGCSCGFRGVNQPLPLFPEVPLPADVVVGASILCLASNISQSVRALPRREVLASPPCLGSRCRSH
ncbi:hypothetical protein GCM10018785_09670 [Streptomyces longispororuber]|uniref:Uncharacterized protein n=1 Tax=Streptomyces longispororuber TaxID=68230 RepID=A0A918Z9Y5_9ACTN|nr:hypothetical protein GCM10018785_09670 [Streptomyces longispororuber]